MQGYRSYNLFSPERHLGVIETAMVVVAAGAIDKAMSMMQLASDCTLELFVRFQLRSIFLTWSRGDIVFASPLLCLADGVFGLRPQK
jgi:hypothetical protein